MKHYGDITKIRGNEVPLVDIVTGGSPCQDLSVAGFRKGLSGERSGLFMEQIRVIKEMRNESIKQLRSRGSAFDIRCVQPRYMVWENVCGAFSSNKGEDFLCVLEETAKIADPNATIPRLENVKWTKSGCILADGWSIAWRVHDAQFWGVPQRRKRISLVADFAGQSTPEILFESKSLQGDFGESDQSRKETTKDTRRNLEKTSDRSEPVILESNQNHAKTYENGICNSLPASMGMGGGYVPMITDSVAYTTQASGDRDNPSQSFQKEKAYTIPSNPMSDRGQAVIYRKTSHPMNSEQGQGWESTSVSDTLNIYDNSENRTPTLVVDQVKVQGTDIYNGTMTGDVAATLNATSGNSSTHSGPSVICMDAYQHQGYRENDTIGTMTAKQNSAIRGDTPLVIENPTTYQKTTGSLCAYGYEKLGTQEATNDMYVVNPKSLVRRLTPLECERLQGYPDGWTDIGEWVDTKGKKHKDADSPRYKALGNSIALPFWEWMADRMVNVLKKDGIENPTMASLFDGIGGFALVYSRCGCQPVWNSEVEEFCEAVTKLRFGND